MNCIRRSSRKHRSNQVKIEVSRRSLSADDIQGLREAIELRRQKAKE